MHDRLGGRQPGGCTAADYTVPQLAARAGHIYKNLARYPTDPAGAQTGGAPRRVRQAKRGAAPAARRDAHKY